MKRKIIRYSLLTAVLFITIGFAAVTTNLILSGITAVGTSDFNVIFSAAYAEEGGTATISPNGKSITYSTRSLKEINDEAELNYTITNPSNNYDANISIATSLDNTYNEYISVTHNEVTFVANASSNSGTIKFKLLKQATEELHITFTVTFTATAVEVDRADMNILTMKNQNDFLSYVDGKETLLNPDRGFYKALTYVLQPDDTFTGGDINVWINRAKQTNHSVIQIRADISELSGNVNSSNQDKLVNQTILSNFEYLLSRLEAENMSLILRFSYDYSGLGGREPQNWSTIQNHIEQFSSVINNHKSIISVIEAGFLGKWGEMHSAGQYQSDTYYFKLLDTLMNNLDKSIKINVRKPSFYELYYGSLSPSREDRYRIGLFDDSIYGSYTDLGTFSDITREQFTDWLNTQAEYTLFGGETSLSSSATQEDEYYSTYESVLPELYKEHLAYLNRDFNSHIIEDKWGNYTYDGDDEYNGETFYKFIEDHMGYRFVVRNSLISESVAKGDTARFSVSIENTGFGNVIYDYDAYLVLKKDNKYYEASLDYDIRNIKSKNTNTIDMEYSIPSDLADGDYDVYIKFIKKNTTGMYIKFANPNIYDINLNANYIGVLEITDSQTTGVDFVQTNTYNGTPGSENTLVIVNPADAIVTTKIIYDDTSNNTTTELRRYTHRATPGATYDYSDANTLNELGIIIPSGYEYKYTTSMLVSWAGVDSITYPDTEYAEYTIEIHVKLGNISTVTMRIYDEADRTRLDSVSFYIVPGNTYDFSDPDVCNALGIVIPNNYAYSYTTGSVVNWASVNSITFPNTANQSYSVELYVKDTTKVRMTFNLYDDADRTTKLATSTVYLTKGSVIDFTDPNTYTTIGITIPNGFVFHHAASSITSWAGVSSLTVPTDDGRYSVEVVIVAEQ